MTKDFSQVRDFVSRVYAAKCQDKMPWGDISRMYDVSQGTLAAIRANVSRRQRRVAVRPTKR